MICAEDLWGTSFFVERVAKSLGRFKKIDEPSARPNDHGKLI